MYTFFFAALFLSSSLFSTQGQACLGGFSHAPVKRAANGTGLPQMKPRLVPRPPRTKTALTNVRVFDGYTVQPPSTVFFEGAYFTSDAANVQNIVDGQGAVLLPGLIDSHTHPNTIADLETFSSYGVTTVLNMQCNDYAQCNSMHDLIGLTSFLTAGIPVVAPNTSHAAHSPNPQTFLTSPAQAADYTSWVFGNGSDWMKIISEEQGPSQELQDAIVLNSHAMGRQTMTHASLLEYFVMAVNSKTDGLQHIPYDKLLDDNTVQQMVLNRQSVTPTLYLFNTTLPKIHVLDPEAPNIDPVQAYGIVQENVRKCRQYGIPVLAGTDSIDTSQYPIHLPYGSSLHQELSHLVEVGFKPADAIRAATDVPAMFHRLGDRGRIAPGYRADLVLLTPDADPMCNISHTLKIARVWNAGIEFVQPYRSTSE